MKQNITLSLEAGLLKRIRVFAARRRISVSQMLAEDLALKVDRAKAFDAARKNALQWLDTKFPLGGQAAPDRDSLHER